MFDDTDWNKPTEGKPLPELTEETVKEIIKALESDNPANRFIVDWRMWLAREYAVKPQPYFLTDAT